MTIDLYTDQPGLFQEKVLEKLGLKVTLAATDKEAGFAKVGSYRNWNILADREEVAAGVHADQLLLLNNKPTEFIRAILIQNVNDALEPNVRVEIHYIEQVTGELREFVLNEWSDRPRTFGSVPKEDDTVDDGLVRNYPAELAKLQVALVRGDDTEKAIRAFVNESSR